MDLFAMLVVGLVLGYVLSEVMFRRRRMRKR